jgi:predicted ATPase
VQLRAVHVAGYRSLRSLHLPLGPLTVVAGANGSGKTNLYRALHLMHAAAQGRLAATIGDEGGMPSLLWAGSQSRKKQPRRVELEAEWDELDYSLALGLEPPPTRFMFDPHVKDERVRFQGVELMRRKEASATARDGEGRAVTFPFSLDENESLLGQLIEPHRFAVLSMLRQLLLGWRFYHHFPTDPAAPARRPRLGMRTTVLAADGRDLAAALATIDDIGHGAAVEAHVERAFAGARLQIGEPHQAQLVLTLQLPGILRPLEAHELSDGTLRYLYLLAALSTPRPPALMVLNEPETSLHPDLYAPLAELIAAAATRSQVVVTTHAQSLVDALVRRSEVTLVRLRRDDAATSIAE